MQFVLIYGNLDYLHIKNYSKILSFQTYIYIYIIRANYIIVFTRCVTIYDMSARIEYAHSKLYEIRDGGCRLIDRIANIFFASACKETSQIDIEGEEEISKTFS